MHCLLKLPRDRENWGSGGARAVQAECPRNAAGLRRGRADPNSPAQTRPSLAEMTPQGRWLAARAAAAGAHKLQPEIACAAERERRYP